MDDDSVSLTFIFFHGVIGAGWTMGKLLNAVECWYKNNSIDNILLNIIIGSFILGYQYVGHQHSMTGTTAI